MNNQKIAGIPGLIGLLMIVSTHSWAKPCTKMIETVQGTEMYMSCHYLKIIAVILGIGLMAISVEGIIKKKVSVFLLMCNERNGVPYNSRVDTCTGNSVCFSRVYYVIQP